MRLEFLSNENRELRTRGHPLQRTHLAFGEIVFGILSEPGETKIGDLHNKIVLVPRRELHLHNHMS